MSTYVLTIGGATKTLQDGSLSIEEVIRGSWKARFDVYDPAGSYRPAIGAEVILTQDGVRIFGGYIEDAEEGIKPRGHALAGFVTRVECTDFNAILKEISITADRPSETLLARLTYFETLLPSGFTLDGSQATGPTLEAQAYQERSMWDAIREIEERLTGVVSTGWFGELGIDKKLRVYQTPNAPFNIDDTTKLRDDMRVRYGGRGYANRVLLAIGQPETRQVSDAFVGDGTTDTWQLTYPFVEFFPGGGGRATVLINSVLEALVMGPSGTPIGSPGWEYDPTTNRVIRTSPVANGETIDITYTGQFPMTVIAQDLTEQSNYGRVVTYRESAPDVFDAAIGQTLADGILARKMLQPRTATFEVLTTAAVHPGQTITITRTARNLSAVACLITDVRLATPIVGGYWRIITAVEGGFQPGWRDIYERWRGKTVSGGSSTQVSAPSGGTSGTSTPATTPGGADTHVQYNDGGAFGGDANLTWHKVRQQQKLISNLWPSLVLEASDGSRSSLVEWSQDVSELFLGAEWDDTAGEYIARGTSAAWLIRETHATYGERFLIGVYDGLTPGNAIDVAADFQTFLIVGGNSGGAVPGLLNVQRHGATGAHGGAQLQASYNDAGNGAAGCLVLQERNGTLRYLWVEGGTLRIHTAPPTENNTTVSHTAGTVVGTQS